MFKRRPAPPPEKLGPLPAHMLTASLRLTAAQLNVAREDASRYKTHNVELQGMLSQARSKLERQYVKEDLVREWNRKHDTYLPRHWNGVTA